MSRYDWDPVKAEANRRRHGVSFDEAQSVVESPLSHRIADPNHSEIEERMRIVGWSISGRLIAVVVSTSGLRPRIISARRATKRERDAYTAR